MAYITPTHAICYTTFEKYFDIFSATAIIYITKKVHVLYEYFYRFPYKIITKILIAKLYNVTNIFMCIMYLCVIHKIRCYQYKDFDSTLISRCFS